MSEVRFYHLQRRSLEQTLPLLLQKVLERGLRAVVMAGSTERVEALTQHLWTFDSASFLPHGSRRDGSAADQPVWLTADAENPNGAQVLVLTDGVDGSGADLQGLGFVTVCDLFDGNDGAAVAAARERWRRCKSAGHDLTYWQQASQGGWERKA